MYINPCNLIKSLTYFVIWHFFFFLFSWPLIVDLWWFTICTGIWAHLGGFPFLWHPFNLGSLWAHIILNCSYKFLFCWVNIRTILCCTLCRIISVGKIWNIFFIEWNPLMMFHSPRGKGSHVSFKLSFSFEIFLAISMSGTFVLIFVRAIMHPLVDKTNKIRFLYNLMTPWHFKINQGSLTILKDKIIFAYLSKFNMIN